MANDCVGPTVTVVEITEGSIDRWSDAGRRLQELDPEFFCEVLYHTEVCVAVREAGAARLKPLLRRATL